MRLLGACFFWLLALGGLAYCVIPSDGPQSVGDVLVQVYGGALAVVFLGAGALWLGMQAWRLGRWVYARWLRN